MHVPIREKMADAHAIHQFIQQYGFATLVSPSLQATHLPLLLKPDQGDKGVLYGHIARDNPHSNFVDGERVLAIFSGPHSYISPTWYATPIAVPTWNYCAVHCYGVIRTLNRADTLSQVKQLITQYEPELVDDRERMPEGYQQQLLNGIIGFTITIDHIDAREKLGQHKHQADQAGVFSALKQSQRNDATVLAAYMARRNIGTGSEK
ncbi:FMN-binding negative transcriptional regulator [Alteromonas ponticola]|uniref:FMN-binding negative transcriptional regulator n=1 Tax=Alteromonas ponticola TaxID=2720613 RepID=A0ABX1R449_9ALTE|nr:FMN-binding negative transcriptional regulator [Alteromonas ponticola]NMH60028.1 FMN-binding negative transcriptional regulator [Alteromonas ponticola]